MMVATAVAAVYDAVLPLIPSVKSDIQTRKTNRAVNSGFIIPFFVIFNLLSWSETTNLALRNELGLLLPRVNVT